MQNIEIAVGKDDRLIGHLFPAEPACRNCLSQMQRNGFSRRFPRLADYCFNLLSPHRAAVPVGRSSTVQMRQL